MYYGVFVMFRQLLTPVCPSFKGKKLSVDFGTLGKAFMPESPRGPSEKSGQSSVVPSVVVSRFVLFTPHQPWDPYLFHHRDPADEEELLSSGQQSPVCAYLWSS